MKKTITKEVKVCEICGEEAEYCPECDSCGKTFCYEHWKEEGQDFQILTHGSCSADISFCNKCIKNPPDKKTGELLSAYLIVKMAIQQRKQLIEQYDALSDVGKEEVNKVRAKYGLNIWD